MAAAPTYPLTGPERRLRDRVQNLLASDEQVLSAIVVLTGPRPGIEGLFAGLAGVFGGLLALVGIGGVFRSRTYFTIAITTRGVVQFKNRNWRRPSSIVARSDDLSMLGPFNETTGDFWVEFRGERLLDGRTVDVRDVQDEADCRVKVARLKPCR